MNKNGLTNNEAAVRAVSLTLYTQFAEEAEDAGNMEHAEFWRKLIEWEMTATAQDRAEAYFEGRLS
jgi:hypothetical protein